MRLMMDDQYETMPWDAVDAVVFDVGNVLLAYSPEEEMEHYFPGDAKLHERLTKKIRLSPYWHMRDRGTITLSEAIEAMTGREKDLHEAVRTLMENWQDFFRPVEEGVAALKACKAQGKKVYVLSNFPDDAFDIMQRRYDFFSLFDGMVVSARDGMLKPGEAIYREAQTRFHLNPERTLFIDDTAINIEAALWLGWQGLCFNDPGKLTRFMLNT